jgi:hypothetical protein
MNAALGGKETTSPTQCSFESILEIKRGLVRHTILIVNA